MAQSRSYDVLSAINRMLESQERKEDRNLDAALRRLAIGAEQTRYDAAATARLTEAEMSMEHAEKMFALRERATVAGDIRKESAAQRLFGQRKEFDADMKMLGFAMDMQKDMLVSSVKRVTLLTAQNEQQLDDGAAAFVGWFSPLYTNYVDDPDGFVKELQTKFKFTGTQASMIQSAVYGFGQSGSTATAVGLAELLYGEQVEKGKAPFSSKLIAYMRHEDVSILGKTPDGKNWDLKPYTTWMSSMQIGFANRTKLMSEYMGIGKGDFVLEQFGEKADPRMELGEAIFDKYAGDLWPESPGGLQGNLAANMGSDVHIMRKGGGPESIIKVREVIANAILELDPQWEITLELNPNWPVEEAIEEDASSAVGQPTSAVTNPLESLNYLANIKEGASTIEGEEGYGMFPEEYVDEFPRTTYDAIFGETTWQSASEGGPGGAPYYTDENWTGRTAAGAGQVFADIAGAPVDVLNKVAEWIAPEEWEYLFSKPFGGSKWWQDRIIPPIASSNQPKGAGLDMAQQLGI